MKLGIGSWSIMFITGTWKQACTKPRRLITLILRLLHRCAPAGADGQQHEVSLSGGLSRALCYISRYAARYAASPRHQAKPRILCLLSAGDTPMQYIPVMNCIFAAQQTGVVIDALVVGQADSALLQQAAHITGQCGV